MFTFFSVIFFSRSRRRERMSRDSPPTGPLARVLHEVYSIFDLRVYKTGSWMLRQQSNGVRLAAARRACDSRLQDDEFPTVWDPFLRCSGPTFWEDAKNMCNLQEYAECAAARRTPLLCRCNSRPVIALHINVYEEIEIALTENLG